MSSASSSSSSGVSFWGLLQILFISLKLTGHISWPWWQVLLPTLIGLGITVVVFSLLAVLAVYSSLAKK